MIESVPSLEPGEVVANRFVVRRLLARFGVNEVHEAHDRLVDRVVDLFSAPVEQSRACFIETSLRRDVALSLRVRHPNVWQLYSYEPTRHGGVIVAEHLEGYSLHKVIRDRHQETGFTGETFRAIARQLSEGLMAIHAAGIVHADLKPGRIQVDGERVVIRMFEFAEDIALLDEIPLPHGGTPEYMSPERLRTGRPSTMDDVYALGKTFLEMWTRRVAAIGANAREKPLREQVAVEPLPRIERWELRHIFTMLHPDPTKRPSASDLHWGNSEEVDAMNRPDPEEERLFAWWVAA